MLDKVSLVIKYKNGQTNIFYYILDKDYTAQDLDKTIQSISNSQNYKIKNKRLFNAVIVVEK